MAAPDAAALAFVDEYARAHGIERPALHSAFGFGDTPALMDELLALVLAGTKRATAGLLRNFEQGPEPIPRRGDLSVVLDGVGRPRCLIRTTEIRIGPLSSVDEAFAWDEGEGDRTRADWLATHRHYFARQAAREGFALDDDIATVFERFTVVWPAASADKPGGKPSLPLR